jgi:cysteine desulfurase / selenocysteine lyase
MIYLDNAATSFPKPERVYDEINKCMREYCANPGRGGHSMSICSGKAVLEARETICSFFNIRNTMQLVFTKNATEALNIGIKGYLNPGDHVITTCMEHNSVIRPLNTMERDNGVSISIIKGNEFGEINSEDIRKAIKPNTKLIVSTLSSNVNGVIMPVIKIGKIAKENGIAFLLDASQGAGTIEIDVQEMNIDMLAFPGHKSLLGPQGIGGLYINEQIKLKSIYQGGTGSNSENLYQPEIMPDLLESGTLNTPGIIGLRYGIDFINSFGLENIKIYKYLLIKKLHEGLESLKGITVYSKNDTNNNSGIAAFNFNGVDSTEVSFVLDKAFQIASRAGLHCAPLAHETLGTLSKGIVRLSVGCFNTIDEIDFTINSLKEIADDVQN